MNELNSAVLIMLAIYINLKLLQLSNYKEAFHFFRILHKTKWISKSPWKAITASGNVIKF